MNPYLDRSLQDFIKRILIQKPNFKYIENLVAQASLTIRNVISSSRPVVKLNPQNLQVGTGKP